MKQLSLLTVAVFTSCLLVINTFGGPEPPPSGKEMKEVAPPPPPLCEWGGFYVGIHGGGQFGHSETGETFDISGFGSETGPTFGYNESGFIGGGQVGYNWQWRWLVLGPEFDVGYMDVGGSGTPAGVSDVYGSTNGGFYTTLRGRAGVAFDWNGCWLLYATGGAIGVDYTTRYHVDPDFFDARRTDFDWGYCVGGGIERQIFDRHWSIKVEYLYFSLSNQSFDNSRSLFYLDENRTVTGHIFGETFGHIVRAGLNYHF
jgi:outer membrane immunogenic protein